MEAKTSSTLSPGNGALQNALNNARDISDQTKLVAAVLDLLYGILPIRKISVAGVLEPPAGREASATFSLQDDVQQAAAITLSVPTTADPVYADYARLARPAAVWIQYEVTRALKYDDELPASAPSSYALLREGIDRQNEANTAEAEGAHREPS